MDARRMSATKIHRRFLYIDFKMGFQTPGQGMAVFRA